MTETKVPARTETTLADNVEVERKVPWWAWVAVAISVVVFVAFFMMFAQSVSSGDM